MEDNLVTEINRKQGDLDKSVRKLRETGSDYAQAEHDYKVLLRIEALKLRDQGMAIGMIDKVVHGVPEVAAARLKRDKLLAIYEANKESINSLKLQIRIIDAQISREWGR